MPDDPPVPLRQPPGWYVDPFGQTMLRWWDGKRWTGPTKQGPPGGSSRAEFRTGDTVRRRLAAPTQADARDDARTGARAPAAVCPPPPRTRMMSCAKTASSGWRSAPCSASRCCSLVAGYALGLDALRLVALTCVLLFGIGTAPLQLSERVPLDVEVRHRRLVGLSVPLVWGTVDGAHPVVVPGGLGGDFRRRRPRRARGRLPPDAGGAAAWEAGPCGQAHGVPAGHLCRADSRRHGPVARRHAEDGPYRRPRRPRLPAEGACLLVPGARSSSSPGSSSLTAEGNCAPYSA